MYTKLCNEFFGVVQCLLSTAYIRGQGGNSEDQGGEGVLQTLSIRHIQNVCQNMHLYIQMYFTNIESLQKLRKYFFIIATSQKA